MRRAAALLSILALLATPLAALAQEEFAAELSGDAEVPPVTTDGSGSATVTISDDESSISFDVTFQDLSGPATMAHIHYGAADEAGPVLIWLTEVGTTDGSFESPISGTADETAFMPVDGGPQSFAEALQAIRDGNTYVNIHTEMNPGGEIRGQLMAAGDGATPPPTSMEDAGAAAGASPIAVIVLLLAGLAVFVVAFRRFAVIRA